MVQLNESVRTAQIRAFEVDMQRFTFPPGHNKHAHLLAHDRALVWRECCQTSPTRRKRWKFFGAHAQRKNEQAKRYWNRQKTHNNEKILEKDVYKTGLKRARLRSAIRRNKKIDSAGLIGDFLFTHLGYGAQRFLFWPAVRNKTRHLRQESGPRSRTRSGLARCLAPQ
jgi:hypothetical protein